MVLRSLTLPHAAASWSDESFRVQYALLNTQPDYRRCLAALVKCWPTSAPHIVWPRESSAWTVASLFTEVKTSSARPTLTLMSSFID